MSGTSMATPYVAGLAALMKSANPAMTYADLKYVLMASSDPVAELQDKVVANGRVNAYRAVVSAVSGVVAPPQTLEPATGQNDSIRKITISAKRYRRRTIIHGYVRSVSSEPLSNKSVLLSCKTISRRRTRSDEDGYYAFKVIRPRRAERCRVVDSLDNRSRSIVVR
jgi:protocatechuate 3,4-dioxygenase beta subunit